MGQNVFYGLIGYKRRGEKTTLLKILSGIYRADSGTAKINGRSVYENPQMKQKCFFMTEEATYFAQSDLLGMRKFYKGYYPEWSDKTFYGLIDLFGVSPRMKISRFFQGNAAAGGTDPCFFHQIQVFVFG